MANKKRKIKEKAKKGTNRFRKSENEKHWTYVPVVLEQQADPNRKKSNGYICIAKDETRNGYETRGWIWIAKRERRQNGV